jgi:hypothetical protein
VSGGVSYRPQTDSMPSNHLPLILLLNFLSLVPHPHSRFVPSTPFTLCPFLSCIPPLVPSFQFAQGVQTWNSWGKVGGAAMCDRAVYENAGDLRMWGTNLLYYRGWHRTVASLPSKAENRGEDRRGNHPLHQARDCFGASCRQIPVRQCSCHHGQPVVPTSCDSWIPHYGPH